MQSGLPIVTPQVGGISELVDETTGWPIHPGDDPEVYVATLRALFADPQEVLRRIERGLNRLVSQHSWRNFVSCAVVIFGHARERREHSTIEGAGVVSR